MSSLETIAIFRALSGRLTPAGRLRALLPLLIWGGLVWTIGGLHHVPGSEALSTGMDKVGHAAMYGVLGYLCGRARRLLGGRAAAVVLIGAALALGAADEWRQTRVVGRTASVADWVADAAGVLGGFLLAVSYARQRQRT